MNKQDYKLQFDNVVIGFRPKDPVFKISKLTISSGEYVFLLGGNGVGKTSFLRTILGLTPILEGTITLDGQQLSQELIAETFGYIPQNNNINADLPLLVRELLDAEGYSSGDVQKKLSEFNAEHLLDKQIRQLSGGELQKVLITRVLLKDTQFILMDEPMNNLDHEARKKLSEIIDHEAMDRGKTIIEVTHFHDHAENKHCVKCRKLYIQEGELKE